MKTYSLNNVKDTLIGQPGTPRRDAYEAKLAEITAKLRPILFSTPMVQAILDGRKTHTRREMQPQPGGDYPTNWLGNVKGSIAYLYNSTTDKETRIKCPHGQPGDVFWVREEHLITPLFNGFLWKCEFKDGSTITLQPKEIPLKTLENLAKRKTLGKWQRARFLPKAFARIFLRITDVQVQRLQDITEADAIAEGVESWIEERMKSRPTHYSMYSDYDSPNDPAMYSSCPILSFESLWRKINGPESWNENPWVWAITFERCENPTQNPKLKTQN